MKLLASLAASRSSSSSRGLGEMKTNPVTTTRNPRITLLFRVRRALATGVVAGISLPGIATMMLL